MHSDYSKKWGCKGGNGMGVGVPEFDHHAPHCSLCLEGRCWRPVRWLGCRPFSFLFLLFFLLERLCLVSLLKEMHMSVLSLYIHIECCWKVIMACVANAGEQVRLGYDAALY